jgi:hypothetical protein
MQDKRKYRLSKATIEADRKTIIAVQSLPGYAPRNATVSAPALMDRLQQHNLAMQAADNTRRANEAAQEFEIEAAWEVHNAAVLARMEVTLQYGDDSFEVESVGRIRSSERKRRSRRPRPATGEA